MTGGYRGIRPHEPTVTWAATGTHTEVDVPVVAIAIAALPAVALLLSFVTRMEARMFGGDYLDDPRLRDRYLPEPYPPVESPSGSVPV